MSNNNNNPPPDRVFAFPKRRLQRDSSSGSTSSVGSTSSASNPFSFGTALTGFNNSQAESFRFGSPTTPAFGDSNPSPFGKTTATVSAPVSAPVTSQPFQFGAAGNNIFQFGSAKTTTPASGFSSSGGFQFGTSNSNPPFGFGSTSKGETQSPFTFGTSNTSSVSNSSGGASMNAFSFGTSTSNTQPAAAAATAPFIAPPQRQETILMDDDDMMSDEDTNNDKALVLANQPTSAEPTPTKPVYSFGTTPPQQEGSGSSSSSTPSQHKQERQQQASEFFSILSTQPGSSTPSSPLVFISPSSTEQINIPKTSAQPVFNKTTESSLSYGNTLANLEDPFGSSPIQKTVEPETKNDATEENFVVIEDLGEDEESKDEASKEPVAEDKEYEIVEPEEANIESENKTEEEDTVVVSTEDLEQSPKEDPSDDDAKLVEVADSDEEDEKKEGETVQDEADKEKEADDQADEKVSETEAPEEEEKPTESSSSAQNTTALFSDVSVPKKSDSEEVKKAAPVFSGFNFGSSQSTSFATPAATATTTSSDKPPPIVFGNASTAAPNVEKPPAFTGFNFSGEAAKLKSTTGNLFGNVQIQPKTVVDTSSERSGGVIRKKRASKAGLPYDTGRAAVKQTTVEADTQEIKAPAPSFPGFNFGKPLSKSPIVEEGPKETGKAPEQTSKPAFPGFNFGKQPPALKPTGETAEVPARKNPFAGFSFYQGGSDEASKATATTQTGSDSEIKKTPTLSFGSTQSVEQPKMSSSASGFGAPQISDSAKPTGTSPFTFGSAATSKEASKTPTFGTATPSSDKSQEPSKTPLFSFGTPSKAPGFGSLATSAEKSKEVNKPLGFTFGGPVVTSEKSKEASKPSGFTFGASPAIASEKSAEASKPLGFTFGASPATTSEKSTEANKPAVFTFGSSSATDDKTKEVSKSSGFTFGASPVTTSEKSAEASKPAGFTFGSTGTSFGSSSTSDSKSKEQSSGPTLSFGNVSSSSDKSKETSTAPGFSFGGGNTVSTDKSKEASKPPVFSFGSGSASTDKSEASPFTFGGAGAKDSSKPSPFTFGNPPSSEHSKETAFSFGSAGEAVKEAAAKATTGPTYSFGGGATSQVPSFSFGSKLAESSTSKTPTFSFGSGAPSDTSKDVTPSPIFKFGSSGASATSFGSSSANQDSSSAERSNKKKRQLDSDEEDRPSASKKTQFSFQVPSAPSSSSNTKKRQLDDDEKEEAPISNKKTNFSFTAPPAASKPTFGDKPKEDTSKEQDKENKSPDFAFGSGPQEGETSTASDKPSSDKATTPAELLPKSAAAKTVPGAALKKPSPLSNEITFGANASPAASKTTGSVVTAFSKKEAIDNRTLSVQPFKLISSELSAEIGTLKSDMINFSDEVLQTRFWQLSPDVQQNMTVFDAFVNAQIDSFKRFEKRTQSGLKDTLTAATEKIKTLSMDTDTLSKKQHHVSNDLEVFKKRVELQKCNIDAAKDYKTQTNVYLQERDERINFQYIDHIADEMESRLKEYQDIIPSMEESILNIDDGSAPSVSDIHNAIDEHGKKLVKLAGKVVNIHDDIQFVRLTSVPPH